MNILIFLSTLIFLNVSFVFSHTHHLKTPHKEREEDGGISPRDHNHYQNKEHDTSFDHEAIIGNVKEAQEFDDLPVEESKKRLAILVKKMDRNRDQLIDRKELHSWILRSFRKLSEEESEERMDESDDDEDGFVTWKEYISETYGIKNEDDISLLDKAIRDEERELMKEDRQLFTAADRNSDGRLDKAEFLSFSHPEEDPAMLSVLLEQTLSEKDLNKDGVISFQEYIGERGEDKDKEWILSEKNKFDHEHDKDGDGILDRNEIIDWIVPSNEEIAEDEVNHLIDQTDEDSDDKLSLEEILNHHDVFVGSEATDYGEHLHNLDRFDDEL